MINLNNTFDQLNDRQKEAVTHTEGPLLILAGAGSGKTKTLVYRILNLIKKGVPPHQILGITFTNKSAKEMRDRILHLLKSDPELNIPISFSERPFMTTFHSLGVHILKENAQSIGRTRNFTIYDRSDSKKAIKEALESIGLDTKEWDAGKILNIISRKKGDFLNQNSFEPAKNDTFNQTVKNIWIKYEKKLEQENALDFDDLLLKTALLLKNNTETRKYYQNKWQYIHIDEYQDTNKVQYEIAKALSEGHKNICAVGDADQTIYSWRGADIKNILDFERDFDGTKVILLEENYRSTKTIISVANTIISKNILRKKKDLFTRNALGEKITLIETLTEADEARAIADKTRELIDQGVKPDEIAILYRANFQSRILEEYFIKKGLPYQLLGIKFFERKEIKDILSLIRASINRSSVSDLVRIINVPPRGIGKSTLLKALSDQKDKIGPSLLVKYKQFESILDKIKKAIETKTVSEAVKFAIKESGMEDFLRKNAHSDPEAYENVGELITLAKKYDSNEKDGMENLLTDASLMSDQDEMDEKRSAVRLMTVHASKGLEFNYVFITGLEKELFPHISFDEDEITEAESEEERRLFYVALTRAKKKLFLSFAKVRTIFGREKFNEPSEFLSDIEPIYLDKEETEEPTGVKAIFIDF